MSQSGLEYIKCLNCGKYTDFAEAVLDKFCSEECSRIYTACPICGKYHTRESGHENNACSKECLVQYKLKKAKVVEITE
jgi:endogenous inhibitor of DNA gyrase (YacG/DUF329 family)